MGNKLYEESSIQSIANAIRTKLGTDAQYKVGDMAAAVEAIPTGIVPTGTLDIIANATGINISQYAYVNVSVPSEYDFRDKTIIPDKYNTGCRGHLVPFDLEHDTSGLHYNTPSGALELKFNTQYSSTIRDVDTSKGPIIYKNIDFTEYTQFQFMACGDCHKEDPNYTPGVVIIFENCLFRKVYTNGSFSTADMIQFVFINCTMEYFNISNSIVYGCKIGNKTFYKNKYGDEVLEDAIGVNDYTTIANSYVMDVEPKVSVAGGAHFDGLQANTEHDYYTLYNVRFECMNMPYDPKGGGWTHAVNFEHAATHLYMMYCIIHGGGYYQCSVKKGENQTLMNNYIEGSYSTPCYPSEQTYQLTDGFAELYSNLYVSSCFADNADITVICTNDTTTAKTLTVIGYNTAQNTSTTYTFNIPACPARDSGWTGIDEWDDLPFDVPCVIKNAYVSGIDKIECYDGTTKLRTWYVTKGVPVPDITATKTIIENGQGIDVTNYSSVYVNVPTNAELGYFDKNIVPDKYNTGAHGFLTPFDLAGDTSGLLWSVDSSNNLCLDFNTNSKQTIYNVNTSQPVIYKDIDFTAYDSINITNANMCSKTDQYWKAGVIIRFENCIFRKVNSNYPFSSADMIQFIFIGCSMYSLKLSNIYAEKCLIGNRTFYKDNFGDEDILDGIKLWSYSYIVGCYIMDLEPKVTTAGSAHYDGLQFTDPIEQAVLYGNRFECMNMPYNPKGGGWSYSIYYQSACANGVLMNNIFHGGGNYQTAVTKLQGSSQVAGNLVEGTYSTPCYPNENYYSMNDDWASIYDTLLVSSVFYDGNNVQIVCSNDIGTNKVLTAKLYAPDEFGGTLLATATFNIPACPTFSGSWTGIDEWDDLPFDKIYTIDHIAQANKIELYDGDTKLRTVYLNEASPFPEGYMTITSNGTYDVANKAAVVVNVSGTTPTGTLQITGNGTYDVTNYASAEVSVSGGLPSDATLTYVEVTQDTNSLVVPYDSTKGPVAFAFAIPMSLQGTANEYSFMLGKMNFLTQTFDQYIATYFNYNSTAEQVYTGSSNAGTVSIDTTNHTVTFTTKGSNYYFKAGDAFNVFIIHLSQN